LGFEEPRAWSLWGPRAWGLRGQGFGVGGTKGLEFMGAKELGFEGPRAWNL